MVGAGRAGHDPRVHAAWSPRLIDLAHHEPCRSTPCRALPRRRDDRQPPRGPVHQLGHRPWSTHPTPLPRPNGAPPTTSSPPRTACAARRRRPGPPAAPRSALRADPGPRRLSRRAHKQAKNRKRKDHLLEHGVDRPRPFRDDLRFFRSRTLKSGVFIGLLGPYSSRVGRRVDARIDRSWPPECAPARGCRRAWCGRSTGDRQTAHSGGQLVPSRRSFVRPKRRQATP